MLTSLLLHKFFSGTVSVFGVQLFSFDDEDDLDGDMFGDDSDDFSFDDDTEDDTDTMWFNKEEEWDKY